MQRRSQRGVEHFGGRAGRVSLWSGKGASPRVESGTRLWCGSLEPLPIGIPRLHSVEDVNKIAIQINLYMKFNFKIQQYQTDAVNAILNVFNGQPYYDNVSYSRNLHNTYETIQKQIGIIDNNVDILSNCVYKNKEIELTDNQLLKNIQLIQNENNINVSNNLINDIGRCSLDIEMETGTGKTYVYIKTIFELNKYYGWNKFIVVVPSIAIREGVNKTFQITTDHFMEQYGKKARFFIYNSSNLNNIDNFSSSSGINVMIINIQAFATSLNEGCKSKEARIIYTKRDEFSSYRPIDVIKSNRPIIIIDEPQKMGGIVTQTAIKNFNPLFCINYSATHTKQHNLVYVLDALDAFNKKLVKKIEVKGFEYKNHTGMNQYIYLENIVLSHTKPPMAKMEIDVAQHTGYTRKIFTFAVGDDLYYKSNYMEQYKNAYIISDIDPNHGSVTFINGMVIHNGEIIGDVVEQDMRRIQIRETIQSHFEKEEKLFEMGIKTLSLFFIDEVSKYRQYDNDGNEILGEYGRIFEEEYTSILKNYLTSHDTPYQKYLSNIDLSNTHKGYFSIDKKTGHIINSTCKRGSDSSDDISAYDLILKNKERLLSFDEPTRFIFSHSALREGWDNPNIFQICTLKHSDSTTQKRQEVGRGLRLCVNQSGNRMDIETLGDAFHTINKLTIIASESYKRFVEDLQSDIKRVLYDRPRIATKDYFEGKFIKVDEKSTIIDEKTANAIERYLITNQYIDMNKKISDKYRNDLEMGTLAQMPKILASIAEGIHNLIQSIFDDSILGKMIENGNQTRIKTNEQSDALKKKEFQELWKYINHQYIYTISFDSNELIRNSINHINNHLFVSELTYVISKGTQTEKMNENTLERGVAFEQVATLASTFENGKVSQIRYDLVGKIAKGTHLTRKTIVTILKGISTEKFALYKANPEEFITNVIQLINEQKATMIVAYISYDQIKKKYDSTIFAVKKSSNNIYKAIKDKIRIQNYIANTNCVGKGSKQCVMKDIDSINAVNVYTMLPKEFYIQTPIGNYSPDYVITFKDGTLKHIFFIAETNGNMNSLSITPIGKLKNHCGENLFIDIPTKNIKYHNVKNYQKLLCIMK